MRRFSRVGLVAAMESEETGNQAVAPAVVTDPPVETPPAADPVPPVADPDPAPVPPAADPVIEKVTVKDELDEARADTVEAELEIDEAEGALTEHNEQVEEATEVVEALESIADVMRISAANGGMDKYSATALGIAVDHMYNRVGVSSKSMPALESFGGTSTRIGATTLAMEDIGEKIKEIWKAIIESIKRAIAWVQDYFSKVWVGAERMKKRAEEVLKRAEETKGEAKEKEFKNAKLVKALHVGGKIPTDFASKAAELEAVIGITFEKRNNIAEVLGKIGTEFAMSLAIDGYKMPVPDKTGLTVVADPEAEGYDKTPEGLEFVRSGELFGGMAVIGLINKSELSGKEGIELGLKLSMKIDKFKQNAAEVTEETVQTLSLEDAKKTAEAVKGIAEETEAYRTERNKLDEELKKFSQEVEALSKKASGEMAEKDQEAFKMAQKIASGMVKQLNAMSVSAAKYAITTGNQMLSYVEQSLKQYGEEAAKSDEKKTEEAAA